MKTLILALAALLSACAALGPTREPIPLVPAVDLPRFMGDWYVIGFIPIFLEKDAHNGIETYALNPDGSIATTYRYREGAFDGPLKTNTPKGFVVEGTNNALWGMQFLWPFKGEFRIAHLEPDYSVSIIARNARDYVWLLARTPEINDADFARYTRLIADMGYDISAFRRQPQRWPEAEPRPTLTS
ncbi:MAG: lipocalin family protein [Panacagrimonas sp.]